MARKGRRATFEEEIFALRPLEQRYVTGSGGRGAGRGPRTDLPVERQVRSGGTEALRIKKAQGRPRRLPPDQEQTLKTEGRLRLFFLPAYAPELNPDESVDQNVRARTARAAVADEHEPAAAMRCGMRRLQKAPRHRGGLLCRSSSGPHQPVAPIVPKLMISSV
ncbi:hypothetical protein HS041_36030 [Planomonospora sp. ID67723]|uniref:hypothetical protein n=1 Tax=Planomonospora sp. ID67723 TaxID=2738134 RepID=UPI0018C3B656|nr:hypothetical protein [Planomonospora sp. ID67723]MBG0833117.1 hypothetical protein [Planomonospora sp. ID67723]